MALRTLSFIHPHNGKKFSLPLEDTILIGDFINRLKSKQVLKSDLIYNIKTISGTDIPDNAQFKNYADNNFIIIDPSVVIPDDGDDDDIFDPPPVNAVFYQLGIFVTDGSGSMYQKITSSMNRAEAVDIASKATFNLFKESTKKECFLFSVVAFGDYAQEVIPVQKVEYLNTNNSFNPLQFFNNGSGSSSTHIYSGLSKAYDIANNFLNNRTSKIRHEVAIILLSDGICDFPAETKRIADSIKQTQNIKIFCCHLQGLLPDTNAQNLLKYIASSPENYQTVYDENTIRKFFISSVSSASGIRII